MILEEIADRTRERIQERKREVPERELKERASGIAAAEKEKNGGKFRFPFEEALRQEGMSFICEVKKRLRQKG